MLKLAILVVRLNELYLPMALKVLQPEEDFDSEACNSCGAAGGDLFTATF